MNADQLVAALFAGVPADRASVETFAVRLRGSSRFRAFVEEYQSKVRKKLRLAEDKEGIGDVLAELRVACSLLSNRSFTVRYEADGVRKTRSPDFAVTYKTHTLFHIEVKRVRPGMEQAGGASQSEATTEDDVNASNGGQNGKLARIVVSKIGQLPAQTPNLIVIVAERQPAFSAAFGSGMTAFHTRATHKDATLFLPYGYENATVFQRQLSRLSGVICLTSVDVASPFQTAFWKNGAARHGLGPELARDLVNALGKTV